MNRTIGLLGPKGSGKTTVANYLTKMHDFREIDHARPIREAFISLVGEENRMYMEDRELKEKPIPAYNFSYREFAQAYGSGGMLGKLNPNWPILASNRQWFEGGEVVFSNLRAEPEIEHVKTLDGAQLWYINRPEHEPEDNCHYTERGFKQYADVIVNNDCSVLHLYTVIDSLL